MEKIHEAQPGQVESLVTPAQALLERLAYLQELREKQRALRAKGKHDLGLSQAINDIDQEVCEWPAEMLQQAAATLRAQAEALERKRWIPVEERLPEKKTAVLGWNGRTFTVITLQERGTFDLAARFFFEDKYGSPFSPTHWQPLPPPPAQPEREPGE